MNVSKDIFEKSGEPEQVDETPPAGPQYHYHYHIYNSPGAPSMSLPMGLPVNHADNRNVHIAHYPTQPVAKRELGKTVTGKRPLTLKGAIRQNANVICGALLLLFFVAVTTEVLPYYIIDFITGFASNRFIQPRHVLDQAVSVFSYSFSFGIALILMKSWLKIPARVAFPVRWKGLTLTIPAIFLCLGVNILGGISAVTIAEILELVFGIVSTPPEFPTPSGGAAIALYMINIVLLPAVLEELIFRGVIMQSLRRYGDGFALMASSILFGLLHGNLTQFIPTFFMGIVMGFFVLRTGSIICGIVLHFVNNGLFVLLSFLTEGGSEEFMIFVNLATAVILLTTGMIMGFFLLWKRPGFFRLAPPPPNVVLEKIKKHRVFFTSVASIVYVVVCIGMAATFFVVW